MKKLLIIIPVVLLVGIIILCCFNKPKMPKENPIVTMEFKDYGEIKIELYPDKAFNTVASFVNLINSGFYKDNAITRIHKDFVVQAGGIKDNGYTIDGEFEQNGYSKNDLSHTTGVISMARTNDPNSAGGQFFIVLSDMAKYSLDGAYAGFGKVIEGLDVLDKLNNAPFVDQNPGGAGGFLQERDMIYITNASVDTKGYDYKVKKN